MQRPQRDRLVAWRAAAVVWLGVSSLLLLLPAGGLPESPSWLPPLVLASADEVAHLTIFAVLAWLLHRADPLGRRSPLPALPVALALCALYGVATELAQRAVPGRTAELSDLIADVVGAGVYWAAAAWSAARSA